MKSVLSSLQTFDTDLLNAVRSLVDPSSAWQIGLVRAFSDSEVLVVAASLVAAWLYARFRMDGPAGEALKKDALTVFYAIMFAFAVYWTLNSGLPARPRPESVSAIRPIIDHLPDNSFPSGHGIFAGSSVWAFHRVFGKRGFSIALLVLAAAMLASRVLAWVHYPGDVVAGFLLGTLLSAAACSQLLKPAFRNSQAFSIPLRIAAFFRL